MYSTASKGRVASAPNGPKDYVDIFIIVPIAPIAIALEAPEIE